MICTFYSFKGGVGRSMALANVAELLCSRGLHVLMIDFDLEAPGLESFFKVGNAEHSPDKIKNARGVIDLLLSYKELRSLPQLDSKETPDNQHQDKFPFPVEPLSNFITPIYKKTPSGGSLSIIPAGRRSNTDFTHYASQVRSFDWNDFYTNWNGEQFFEWFRHEAGTKFDIVLVDSRTGVTEMGGICNYQLADVVILFVAPNQQNLDGIEWIARSLRNPKLIEEGRNGRPLSLIFVPSRIENGEKPLLDNFEEEFSRRVLARFPNPQLTFEKSAFIDLKIPYVPHFAYTENVAVREAKRASTSDLVTAFSNLTLAIAQLSPDEHRLKTLLTDLKNTNRHVETAAPTVTQSQGGSRRESKFVFASFARNSSIISITFSSLILLLILLLPYFDITTFYSSSPFILLSVVFLSLLLIFISIISIRISRRAENQSRDLTFGWITNILQTERIARFYRTYLQSVYRYVDTTSLPTRGMYTLEVEQMFVNLEMSPRTLHTVSSNPTASRFSNEPASQHSLWDYLASKSLQNQQLVILGAPGSGKTTLLKHLALTLVNHKKRRSLPQHIRSTYSIPFLLFLREHVQDIQAKPNFSLVEAIETMLSRWGRSTTERWAKHQLDKGGCLILLDGLDEVADPSSRKRVVQWIQDQMIMYWENRFVITSRPFGFQDNLLNGVTVLEVQPFTLERVRQFVHNWYLANEIKESLKDDPGVRKRASEGAKDLMRLIGQTPALISLAANPLLLTMIVTTHRYRSSLPSSRAELYAEICEVLLGRRQEVRNQINDLNSEQSLIVLQPLAYAMMVQGRNEVELHKAEAIITEPLAGIAPQMSPRAFLRMVENLSGLFLERKAGFYGFAHQVFQEYLAATYIREQGLENVLTTQVEASWWHETTRLYCAQADATPIMEACLAVTPLSVSALTLALDCLQEALRVSPPVQKRIDYLIKSGVEGTDPELQRVAAEVLLTRRLDRMNYIGQETYVDTSLVSSAEYQLFLNDRQMQDNHSLSDRQNSALAPVHQGQSPILHVQQTDAEAFCKWLTEREGSVWKYRRCKEEDFRKTEFITPEMQRQIAEGGILLIKEPKLVNDNLIARRS